MNQLKTTKYMGIFTMLGYIAGFATIIWYSVFGGNVLLVVVGVVVIFLGRTIGYGIDRLIELNAERKK